MPASAQTCVNHALNELMCPCTNTDCSAHGMCCECLKAHAAAGKANACMRGAKRDPSTLGLGAEAAGTCSTNGERNRSICPCDWELCNNRGVCCNCVRNHFNTVGTGRVACMRALA